MDKIYKVELFTDEKGVTWVNHQDFVATFCDMEKRVV